MKLRHGMVSGQNGASGQPTFAWWPPYSKAHMFTGLDITHLGMWGNIPLGGWLGWRTGPPDRQRGHRPGGPSAQESAVSTSLLTATTYYAKKWYAMADLRAELWQLKSSRLLPERCDVNRILVTSFLSSDLRAFQLIYLCFINLCSVLTHKSKVSKILFKKCVPCEAFYKNLKIGHQVKCAGDILYQTIIL